MQSYSNILDLCVKQIITFNPFARYFCLFSDFPKETFVADVYAKMHNNDKFFKQLGTSYDKNGSNLR